MREEPRLREQDFGNFQRETLMKESKRDRARFGRFFFRFPEGALAWVFANLPPVRRPVRHPLQALSAPPVAAGESASDVYDRITGFRETLRNDMELGRCGKRRKSP